jgi:Flp pilus assembly pilin Flp
MVICNSRLKALGAGLARATRRFLADRRGATAVEFGLVAAPFFAFVLAIMTIGTQYLTLHFLEHGVAQAARKLRTGEAQKAGLTLADFRNLVCESAGSYISCDNHLVIHIRSSATFDGLDDPPISCMTGGNLTPSSGSGTDGIRTRAGDASEAVLVTVCYDWELGSPLWQTLWNIVSPVPATEGKIVLSAATAFRSEPFE